MQRLARLRCGTDVRSGDCDVSTNQRRAACEIVIRWSGRGRCQIDAKLDRTNRPLEESRVSVNSDLVGRTLCGVKGNQAGLIKKAHVVITGDNR